MILSCRILYFKKELVETRILFLTFSLPHLPTTFVSLILLSEPNSYCEIPIICHLICVVFPGFPDLMCSVLPYSEHNHAQLWGAWEG